MSSAITLTFGDRAENQVRMQIIGEEAKEGFSTEELVQIHQSCQKQGFTSEFYDLNTLGGVGLQLTDSNGSITPVPQAAVVVIRGGLEAITAPGYHDVMWHELTQLQWDQKALMWGQVKNKHARWNLCFASGLSQEPNYEMGHGRIVDLQTTPFTEGLARRVAYFFGSRAQKLVVEGNYYHDLKKCGIGYHGDSERKIVIGVRLGASFPLCFQWHNKGQGQLNIGKTITLQLNAGDLYVMSDEAVGYNWKKRSRVTLRHAAGAPNYIVPR